MKGLFYATSMVAMAAVITSCGNGGAKKAAADSTAMAADSNVVVLFDGTSLDGWRGYNKDTVPSAWTLEDGCIKINGSGAGEARCRNGGDLIFGAEKFGNFELSFEWKVAKGSNSGVFYMIQEVPDTPSYYSAPEYPDPRQREPPRREAGCGRQPQVGVALRYDPGQAAEFQTVRRMEHR